MAESIEMCELLNTKNHYCFDANNKGPLYFPLDGKLRRGWQGGAAIYALTSPHALRGIDSVTVRNHILTYPVVDPVGYSSRGGDCRHRGASLSRCLSFA
jgi:hypothetical protein